MRYFGAFIALALLAAAVYFFGASTTGFVTSQTCCLPPDCPLEYQCTAAGYGERSEPALVDARLSVLFIFAAGTVFIAHELAVKP